MKDKQLLFLLANLWLMTTSIAEDWVIPAIASVGYLVIYVFTKD